MSSSVTIDGLTAPAAASLEVANACGSFHSVQHCDSLHRANEPWVMQQDRGKVIAAQKRATCVVCRHKPPPPSAPPPLFILSLRRICKVHLRCQSPCADRCNQMLDFREDARRKGIWSPSIPQRPAFIPTRPLTLLVVPLTGRKPCTRRAIRNRGRVPFPKPS